MEQHKGTVGIRALDLEFISIESSSERTETEGEGRHGKRWDTDSKVS